MTCSVCGNSTGNRTFEAREMMFGTGDRFTYLECGNCGCVQLPDVPADLSPFYPPNYYSFTPAIAKTGRKLLMKRLRDRYAATGRGVLGRLLYQYPLGPHPALHALSAVALKPNSAILDVGCGQGNLLRELQDIGFTNLLGVDPFLAHDLEYPGGLRILKRSLAEISGHFDLIMLHHVFEHLPNPQEMLGQMAERLAPGGTVLLRIPVADSYAYRHYGADWAQLDAPRHLFLHTRRSIQQLGNAVGLRVVKVVNDSMAFQFWGSEQYRQDIPLMAPESYRNRKVGGLFSPAQIQEFTRRAEALNRASEGDQAAFYLQHA
ncbi:MAG: class I SAM-dependent methyltransferase [Cytophagaceae bacterium]|nr:class I SAM-dependent methyltransferase [Cytophagaceae bacterium]